MGDRRVVQPHPALGDQRSASRRLATPARASHLAMRSPRSADRSSRQAAISASKMRAVAGIDEEFRMPLHAEAEPVARHPRCPRSRRPARSRSPRRRRRDRAPPDGAPSSPASSPAPTMRCSSVPARDRDGVAGLVARVGLLVLQRVGDRVGDVLDQRAAQRHRQQLLAAADAQHRQVARQRALASAPVRRRCGPPSASPWRAGRRRHTAPDRRRRRRRSPPARRSGRDSRRPAPAACGSATGRPPAAAIASA